MMMRLNLFLGALVLSTTFGSIAAADADWSKAHECFNAGDYDCAYDVALKLFGAGRIAVGNDHRTTDSMIFFQMAYMEKSARVSKKEALIMSGRVIEKFGQVRARLPFLWGFALLVNNETCNNNEECSESIRKLYCRVDAKLPPPSWRPLNDLNSLSETGRKYFERVMRYKPECRGA